MCVCECQSLFAADPTSIVLATRFDFLLLDMVLYDVWRPYLVKFFLYLLVLLLFFATMNGE